MVNTQYLEELIDKSGKKKSYLAQACGLSRAGFRLKCIGVNDFTAAEINILCQELSIKNLSVKEKVFFANGVH